MTVEADRNTVSLGWERESDSEMPQLFFWLLFPPSVSLLPLFRLFLCLSLSESTIPEPDTFSQNILKTLSEFVPNVSQFLRVSKQSELNSVSGC